MWSGGVKLIYFTLSANCDSAVQSNQPQQTQNGKPQADTLGQMIVTIPL